MVLRLASIQGRLCLGLCSLISRICLRIVFLEFVPCKPIKAFVLLSCADVLTKPTIIAGLGFASWKAQL